jgi:hypothetical protein
MGDGRYEYEMVLNSVGEPQLAAQLLPRCDMATCFGLLRGTVVVIPGVGSFHKVCAPPEKR